jgi:hypothetical protein
MNILILRRYQLHSIFATTSCPNGSMDAHSWKKKFKKKEKSRYSVSVFTGVAETPPEQHLNVFNKVITGHNQLRLDLGFSPWKVDIELFLC